MLAEKQRPQAGHNQRVRSSKPCEMTALRSSPESPRMAAGLGWWEQYIEVAYERGHIEFFERVLSATGVWRLVIVSPWIASLDDDTVTLQDIVNYVERYHVETFVVMRSPQKEPRNVEAANLLKSRIGSWLTLYYNNGVHAKIYVCRCQPFGFALLGSANLTPHGSRSYEVGLIVNGFGAGQRIVEELELVGTDYIPGKSESSLEWAPWFRR